VEKVLGDFLEDVSNLRRILELDVEIVDEKQKDAARRIGSAPDRRGNRFSNTTTS